METENRVVWSEGMFLRPQHFQQEERYVERLIRQRLEASSPYGWGFRELQIDHSALAIGRVGLSRAAGVFDDGTTFSIPEDADAPAPIDLAPSIRDRTIFLALPARRVGVPETLLRDQDDVAARYAARTIKAPDAIFGSSQVSEVKVARPRLRLVVEADSDALAGFTLLPIARVLEVRGSDRQVVLDKDYIPPCTTIAAIPRLVEFCQELQGLLFQRAEALAARLSAPSMRGSAELGNLSMLVVVNRYSALSAQRAADPKDHPRAFLDLLLSISGELATFTSQRRRPPLFPAYVHLDLASVFNPVIAAVRQSLSAVLEQGAVKLDLQERSYGVRVALIPDRKLLTTAAFYLAARADVKPDALQRGFPPATKIGPVERIAQLVNVAVPGIAIHPVPVAPPQLPYAANTCYFEFDRSSPFFQELATSGGIAIHVSGNWPKLELELWAARTSG